MSDRCFELAELDEILRSDPSDSRRSHLETCPRCRARLLVYQEFQEDLSALPGADPGDAAIRLRAAFDQELRRAARPEGFVESGRPATPLERVARLRWPRLRVAWAFASVALVMVILYAGLEIRHGRQSPDVLRDLPERASPEALSGPDPISTGEGSSGLVELRWRRARGAEGYRVRLFGPDLADLAQLGPVADTVLVLRREDVPGQTGRTIGWQVAALRGGLPFAMSRPGTVRVP
jgi:hypothetical protein